MTKRIAHAAHPWSLLFLLHGRYFGGPRRDRPRLHPVRVRDEQINPHRCTTEGTGAQIAMIRRLIGDEQAGAIDRQSGEDAPAFILEPEVHNGAERRFIELDGCLPVAHRQVWNN